MIGQSQAVALLLIGYKAITFFFLRNINKTASIQAIRADDDGRLRMMENLNTTVNGTQSAQTCYSPSSLTTAKIGKTFACCLFLVVSLAGNTLIAVIIYKTKTMRTTTNYFILNMAISDVLLPILVFPSSLLEIDESFSLFSGEQGQAFCRVKFFIQYVSSLVSIVNLVLIAVDRFGAVVFPFRRPLIGSKRCPFFILTTWVALIVLSSPIFFSYKSVEHTGRLNCELMWKRRFFRYALNVHSIDIEQTSNICSVIRH